MRTFIPTLVALAASAIAAIAGDGVFVYPAGIRFVAMFANGEIWVAKKDGCPSKVGQKHDEEPNRIFDKPTDRAVWWDTGLQSPTPGANYLMSGPYPAGWGVPTGDIYYQTGEANGKKVWQAFAISTVTRPDANHFECPAGCDACANAYADGAKLFPQFSLVFAMYSDTGRQVEGYMT